MNQIPELFEQSPGNLKPQTPEEIEEKPFHDPQVREHYVEKPRQFYTSKIGQFAHHPDVLIRDHPLYGVEKDGALDDKITEIERIKNLFEELGTYGIATPKTRYVLGENKAGTERIEMIVDRVVGFSLDSQWGGDQEVPEGLQEKLDVLYQNLCRYLLDKLMNKKSYFSDIYRLDQFMYGHTASDSNDQIYLVDQDTWDSKEVFGAELPKLGILIAIQRAEHKLGGAPLEKARAAYEELTEFIKKEEARYGALMDESSREK